MEHTQESLERDIETISQIKMIPDLLETICRTTGMGFAAVARVTPDRWIACGVHDEISFGMLTGDELDIKTTICYEIEQSRQEVVIDDVEKDPLFSTHHTPRQYGFKSYISVPLILKNGEFFGTLCAIDPKPNNLTKKEVRHMFHLFADLISFEIEKANAAKKTAVQQITESYESEEKYIHLQNFTRELESKVKERTHELSERNSQLEKINRELQSFTYISSHDLQEPLRKIQTYAGLLIDREQHNLSENGKEYCRKIKGASARMQQLISDLLSYSRSSLDTNIMVPTDLNAIAAEVNSELSETLIRMNGKMIIHDLGSLSVVPFQFMQLLYNLVSNSLKFSHRDRKPEVVLSSEVLLGRETGKQDLLPHRKYYHFSISDNGIGFDPQYAEQIFEPFQRLHERIDYEGSGIGLSIVKKIVDNHGGSVYASSEKGNGARFDIYFPISG